MPDGISAAFSALGYSAGKNSVFLPRRIEKGSNGSVGSYAVALGQGTNTVLAVNDALHQSSELDKYLGKGFKESAVSISEGIKASPALSKAAAACKWAGEHVNPLIIAAAGVDVIMADKDKRFDVAAEKVTGLSSMFFAENLFKKNDAAIAALIEKLPLKGKWNLLKPVIKGLAFAAASIVGYKVGTVAGEKIIDMKNGVNDKKQYYS